MNKNIGLFFLDFCFDTHYFRVRVDFQFMAIQTMYVLEAPAVSGSSLFPMARREKEEGGGGNAGSERRREVIRQKREKRSKAT